MIVPVLLTASILGGIYFLAPRAEVAMPEPPRTTPRPIPTEQIPTELQRRMQDALVQLPPQYQAAIPAGQLTNPAAWMQLAQSFGAAFPTSPQSPELLAIANALGALQGQQPAPIPVPPGPVPLPPALQMQVQQVLAGLPPPFNNPNVLVPPPMVPGLPGLPGQQFSVDPAQLMLLASQIEAALGMNRPEPAQLRAIAAQVSAMAPRMSMDAVNIAPASQNAASVYEEIIRSQGGMVSPGASDVLAFIERYQGGPRPPQPPVAGVYRRGFV